METVPANENTVNVADLVETRTAETSEEAQEMGFIGTITSLPNELHHAGNEQARADVFGVNTFVPEPLGGPHRASFRGAVVNSDDAPEPSGGTSGPGAGTDDDE